MKVTSAFCNKMLKQLDEEKAYLLTMEKTGNTFIASSAEEGKAPEYDYRKTQQELEELDDKIMKIKHAVNLSNATTMLQIGDESMTVDMILVKMAQLNRRKTILDSMRKMRNGERAQRRLVGSELVPEYTFLNFNQNDVRKDYERISGEIMKMQLVLDRHNQVDEFEVDVEI